MVLRVGAVMDFVARLPTFTLFPLLLIVGTQVKADTHPPTPCPRREPGLVCHPPSPQHLLQERPRAHKARHTAENSGTHTHSLVLTEVLQAGPLGSLQLLWPFCALEETSHRLILLQQMRKETKSPKISLN